MNTRNLGDIDLKDYLRLVRREHPWRRPLRILLGVLVCTVCVAAGRYGPWSGKGSSSLTLAEALELLEKAPETAWQRELSTVAVHRHVQRALDSLAIVADEPGDSGARAGRSLRHLARRAVSHIKQGANHPEHAAVHVESLRLLGSDMGK